MSDISHRQKGKLADVTIIEEGRFGKYFNGKKAARIVHEG
jgi:hypothetical protein